MAKIRVKANFENRPKDALIDVMGIGAIKNGESITVEVDDEQAKALKANPGLQVSKATSKEE